MPRLNSFICHSWSRPVSTNNHMSPQARSELISTEDCQPSGFKWLTLKRIKYKDPTGRERAWESAERVSRHGNVDGVAIIAHVLSKEKQGAKLILESQFRPSQGSYVIEFPAGLIDKGESPAEAALRELKEETGYVGEVTDVSTIGYSDPGMTNSNMQAVTVHVDADASENRNVKPELEEGEFIDVFLLPFDGLYERLKVMQQEKGLDIDARLLMYAMGLEQAKGLLR